MKKVFLIVMVLVVALSSLSAVALKPYKVDNMLELSNQEKATMVGDEYTSGYMTNRSSRTGTLLFNLRNNYRTMTCTIGTDDMANLGRDSIFYFYVDNVLVGEYTISGGDFPEDIEINLDYHRQLKIEVENTYIPNYGVVTNIDFK